jgi:hypothetical protein
MVGSSRKMSSVSDPHFPAIRISPIWADLPTIMNRSISPISSRQAILLSYPSVRAAAHYPTENCSIFGSSDDRCEVAVNKTALDVVK